MSLKHVGPLVRDFMGKGVVTVDQESDVSHAVRAMDEHNIGSVVVLDSLGPCGVFTERDLITRVLSRGKDPSITAISEVSSPRFPAVGASMGLEEVASAMMAKKSRLMVFEGADLVGIVTPTDIIRVLKGAESDFSILKVISTHVVTALPEASVGDVVRLMDEGKVGSVLMSGGDRWTGIFTERDLVKRVLARDRDMDTPLSEVASVPLVTAEPGIFGREAAGIMSLHGFKRLPLWLDDEGVGVVTARDIVQAFADAHARHTPKIGWVQWN